jgi:hypothetical protein
MADTFTVAPWGEAYPGVVQGKPSFTFRFLTIAECRKLNEIVGPATTVKGNDVADADRLAAFLTPFYAQQPGEPAKLSDAFEAMYPHEMDRLVWRIRIGNRLGPAEKKGSESPSSTSTGPSAPDGARTAKTRPANSNRPSSIAPAAAPQDAESADNPGCSS